MQFEVLAITERSRDANTQLGDHQSETKIQGQK